MKYSFEIMKRLLIVLIGWLCLATQAKAEDGELRLGAERMEVVTRLLQGKKVGLVVNQTSILEQKQVHHQQNTAAGDEAVGNIEYRKVDEGSFNHVYHIA